MDEDTKSKVNNSGLLIETSGYDIKLKWRSPSNVAYVEVMKRKAFGSSNHPDLTEEDINQIIADLRDLADWREYRRLRNKLSSDQVE